MTQVFAGIRHVTFNANRHETKERTLFSLFDPFLCNVPYKVPYTVLSSLLDCTTVYRCIHRHTPSSIY